jgi:hypothetical protein
MTIIITDKTGASTVIGVGQADHRTKVTAADQIVGWKASKNVRRGGKDAEANPFGASVGGGECLFEASTLSCFAGAMDPKKTNVALALGNFPALPTEGSKGNGTLYAPPCSGVLAKGVITWEIQTV